MTHTEACTLLVAEFEGYREEAYQDGNKIWTIGYGHTKSVKPGDTCTQEQAEQWLSDDLNTAAAGVTSLVTVPLTQNEFDALTSFVYNVGAGKFQDSTLRYKLNAGQKQEAINSICYADANGAWHGWVFVAGEVSKGLVRRRQAEQALFNRPEAV